MTLVVLGVVLVALVVRGSLVAYMAEVAPNAALMLAPNNPAALLRAAELEVAVARKHLSAETQSEVQPEAKTNAKAPSGSGQRTAVRRPADEVPAKSPQKNATPAASEDDDATGEAPAGPPEETFSLDRALERAERALAANPLSARAIRIMGEIAEMIGDQEKANKLIGISARRNMHESMAVYLNMKRSHEAGDYASAINFADVLLRTQPQLAEVVIPMLVQIYESGDGGDLLNQRLATNPVWRPRFMNGILDRVTDARTPLNIYVAQKNAGSPPTLAELRLYLNRLIRAGLYDLAYYSWLQFIPQAQLSKLGLLYNGDFQLPNQNLPFEWVLRDGPGARVEIVSDGMVKGNRSLHVELISGRVRFGEVSQRLMLSPGAYKLSGKFKGELVGRRGMRWKILCPETSSKPIAESDMFIGRQQDWGEFELAFKVPAEDCKSQQVRLVHDARHASEEFVKGDLLYDDVKIARE